MRLISQLTVSVVLCILVLVSCTTDPAQKAVAKIGSESITVGEFKDALHGRYGENRPIAEITQEERQKVLDDLIFKYKKVQYAKSMGLEKDSAFQVERQKVIDRQIAMGMYEDQVIKHFLSNKRVKRFLDWQDQEVEAVVIQLGHQDALRFRMKRTRDEAETLAQQYADSLALAQDPEAYAKSKTDDPRNRPYFKRFVAGRFNFEIDSLVFTGQPGTIVGPIETPMGFVIFRVLSVADYFQPKGERSEAVRMEEMREKLRPYLKGVEQERFEFLTESYRQKMGFEYDENQSDQFVVKLNEWGNTPGRTANDIDDSFYGFKLAQIDGFELTSKHFFDYFGTRITRDWSKFKTADDIYNGFVLPQLNLKSWAAVGAKAGWGDNEKIAKKLKSFEQTSLPQILEMREVLDHIKPSEGDLLAYFQRNRLTFKQPERIRIYQIVAASETEAKKIVGLAKAGNNFRRLYDQYTDKNKRYRFDLGYQTSRSRFPRLVEEAFKAGPNQTAGPVKIGKQFYVIQTGDLQEARERAYEDVKESVRRRLETDRRKELSDKLLKQVNENISHSVDEKLLQEIG